MPRFSITDFSGGLNLRDSALGLGPNETPDASNWTLDERAAAKVRPGATNQVSLPAVSGKPAFPFYSKALNQWLLVRETAGAPNRQHLWTRPGDLSGSWTDRGDVAGTNQLPMIAAFVDFPGNPPKVVISSGDGAGVTMGAVYTWDGTTLTQVANLIGGYALALWQNRVWLCGFPLSNANGVPSSLFASAIGDPATWATGSGGLRQDLRDLDGDILTGLGVAAGGLHVFKRRSAYRIVDPVSADYHTIDPYAGLMGPLAVVAQHGRLYTWGADSLYEWDGGGAGRDVGDKGKPLFATDPALIGTAPSLAGGALQDRLLFAYPLVAAGADNGILEYSPEHRWLMRSQLRDTSPQASISGFASKAGVLYAAVYNRDQLWSLWDASPGADAGTAFNNHYRTAWIEPADGKLCRITSIELEGLLELGASNTFGLTVYRDGDPTGGVAGGISYDLTAQLRSPGGGVEQQIARVLSLPPARSYAFTFGSSGTGNCVVRRLSAEYEVLEA